MTKNQVRENQCHKEENLFRHSFDTQCTTYLSLICFTCVQCVNTIHNFSSSLTISTSFRRPALPSRCNPQSGASISKKTASAPYAIALMISFPLLIPPEKNTVAFGTACLMFFSMLIGLGSDSNVLEQIQIPSAPLSTAFFASSTDQTPFKIIGVLIRALSSEIQLNLKAEFSGA